MFFLRTRKTISFVIRVRRILGTENSELFGIIHKFLLLFLIVLQISATGNDIIIRNRIKIYEFFSICAFFQLYVKIRRRFVALFAACNSTIGFVFSTIFIGVSLHQLLLLLLVLIDGVISISFHRLLCSRVKKSDKKLLDTLY